jgi:hypothetical protein
MPNVFSTFRHDRCDSLPLVVLESMTASHSPRSDGTSHTPTGYPNLAREEEHVSSTPAGLGPPKERKVFVKKMAFVH